MYFDERDIAMSQIHQKGVNFCDLHLDRLGWKIFALRLEAHYRPIAFFVQDMIWATHP
jgi:hypothetical protein